MCEKTDISGFLFAKNPLKSSRAKFCGNEFRPFGNEFWTKWLLGHLAVTSSICKGSQLAQLILMVLVAQLTKRPTAKCPDRQTAQQPFGPLSRGLP